MLIELREYKIAKKPKVDLFLPSWRVVEIPRFKNSKARKKEKPEEDTSDEAFNRRHSAAEEAEQKLWDHWRSVREKEDGRDVVTPRLRSERVASCSTPGRLSPTSMDKVREICVLPSTPTRVTVQTVHNAFHTNVGSRKIREDQASSLRKGDVACEKSPVERCQEELVQVRRKTSGSSRLRRSLPDVRFKENISCHLLNQNQSPSEVSEPDSDRILKDSNVEEKKNVQPKTR